MLIQADARHIPLKDGCVQCVVTSPPYWGLRDYGTVSWSGGDPDCQHRIGNQVPQTRAPDLAIVGGVRPGVDASTCLECGASRVDSQIGLEPTPEEYVAAMVDVFREVWRVLRGDGVCWLNLGDSYASDTKSGGRNDTERMYGKDSQQLSKHITLRITYGLKEKDLVGIPWRVAFALQADGWYLRSDIIWAKPNPMPESVTDRPTKSHEYLFLLTKSARYFYDAEAIREKADPKYETRYSYDFNVGQKELSGQGRPDGASNTAGVKPFTGFRNKRSVWTITTKPTPYAHFATFPPKLIEPCILAGSKPGDIVFDPFCGSGTTLRVAEAFNRVGVGCDLAYHDISKIRTRNIQRQLVGL